MTEPLMPVPAPERDPYWNPAPARCSECDRIIDAHPASRADGSWEGYCPEHGTVLARYPGTQDSEYPDEEDKS